jgi:hypothetical protein
MCSQFVHIFGSVCFWWYVQGEGQVGTDPQLSSNFIFVSLCDKPFNAETIGRCQKENSAEKKIFLSSGTFNAFFSHC